MFDNENVITDEVIEEVEESTKTEEVETKEDEPSEKVYTEKEHQEKVKRTLDKKIPRLEAKIRKEYKEKYGQLESVLKAGTGIESVEEIAGNFRKFYEEKGIQIPTEPLYSEKDIRTLAKVEAEEIIDSGWDEVVEEVDRLAKKGVKNMSPREKEVFRTLAEYRKSEETGKELAKIGVGEDVYKSKEFQEFASKFSSKTPVTEIYNIYHKMQPQKEVKQIGSVKTTATDENAVKDFYSYEEAIKFEREELDKNPKLFKTIQESMRKWK